jgi:hypothetical protein
MHRQRAPDEVPETERIRLLVAIDEAGVESACQNEFGRMLAEGDDVMLMQCVGGKVVGTTGDGFRLHLNGADDIGVAWRCGMSSLVATPAAVRDGKVACRIARLPHVGCPCSIGVVASTVEDAIRQLAELLGLDQETTAGMVTAIPVV